MYTHIYVYMYMYMCIYVYIHVYIQIYTYAYICRYTWLASSHAAFRWRACSSCIVWVGVQSPPPPSAAVDR